MRVVRTWPHSQAAKTSPSHGEGMGSIPVRVTKSKRPPRMGWSFAFDGPYGPSANPARGRLCKRENGYSRCPRAWGRSIAAPLPCRKPCRARQIPVRVIKIKQVELRFDLFYLSKPQAWHGINALAHCMESPKAYGITRKRA